MRGVPIFLLVATAVLSETVYAQTVDFECPPGTLSIEYSGGSKIILTGQVDGACVGTAFFYYDRTDATRPYAFVGPTLTWTSQNPASYIQYAKDMKTKFWPLQIGKVVTGHYKGSNSAGFTGSWDYRYTVDSYEKVATPAGVFDVFRVTRLQSASTHNYKDTLINWYAPTLKAVVKYEFASPTTRVSRVEAASKISQ